MVMYPYTTALWSWSPNMFLHTGHTGKSFSVFLFIEKMAIQKAYKNKDIKSSRPSSFPSSRKLLVHSLLCGYQKRKTQVGNSKMHVLHCFLLIHLTYISISLLSNQQVLHLRCLPCSSIKTLNMPWYDTCNQMKQQQHVSPGFYNSDLAHGTKNIFKDLKTSNNSWPSYFFFLMGP